jgi:hypothetical protein
MYHSAYDEGGIPLHVRSSEGLAGIPQRTQNLGGGARIPSFEPLKMGKLL